MKNRISQTIVLYASYVVLVAILITFLLVRSAHPAEMICDNYPIMGRKWKIIKASHWEVRDIWDSRRPDMAGYPVESLTDFGLFEIWYTDIESLEHELDVVESGPEGWRKEARQDINGYMEWRIYSGINE